MARTGDEQGVSGYPACLEVLFVVLGCVFFLEASVMGCLRRKFPVELTEVTKSRGIIAEIRASLLSFCCPWVSFCCLMNIYY